MVGGGGLLGLWGCLGVGGWAVWFVELEAPQKWQVGALLLIYIIYSFGFARKEQPVAARRSRV